MSKANQAFKQNDEAVSPVIGVILMVAITVVLAAVVFVLVSNLGEGADANKPRVSFSKDEQGTALGGILTVVSIENGPITLDQLFLGGSAGDSCVFNSGAASITGAVGTVGQELEAGDQFTCDQEGTITVTHRGTDSLLYSGSFA